MKPADALDLSDSAVQKAVAKCVSKMEIETLQQFAQLLRKTVQDDEKQAASPVPAA